MKKLLGILLAALIIGSTLGFMPITPIVYAQPEEEWPNKDVNGDGNVDIEDAIQYLKDNFVSYDEQSESFYWGFTDPNDIAMANTFIKSMFEVEYIRNANDDITILGFLSRAASTPGGMDFENFDGTISIIDSLGDIVEFVVKNYLQNTELMTAVFEQAFEVPELVNLLESVGAVPTDTVEEAVEFLYEKGLEWFWYIEPASVDWDELELDTGLADITEYPNLAKASSVFRMALKGYELVNIFVEHALVIWDILSSPTILDSVKKYEVAVELVRFELELAGKLLQTLLEEVTQPAVKTAITKGVVTATLIGASLGGPLGGVIAGVGMAIAGIILYWTVSDIIDKTLDFAADEALGLDLALHRRLSAEPKPVQGVSPWRIRVRIFDQNDDHFIPWGPGCQGEKLMITVQNTGVKTLNVRVEPTSVPNGWEVSDQQLDGNNWREVENVEPGQEIFTGLDFWVKSGTIDNKWTLWDPMDDEWIPGDNPGSIELTFWHDVFTQWWDFFDWVPGGLKDLCERTEIFYNSVEAYVTVSSGLHPTRGERVQRTIEVVNMKTNAISFVPGVSFRDPFGEVAKYDPQIEISAPDRVVLNAWETASFNVQWKIPLDAPTGFYQIAVNCWKHPYTSQYVDNLEWKIAFFVYDLEILAPSTEHPAQAGDPSNPSSIFAFVTGLPPFHMGDDPTFSTEIGEKTSSYEIVDPLPVPIGYTLKLICPTQTSEGKYDLEIFMSYGTLSSSDLETEAVEYGLAPSVEPIEKGLAWLRTSQYGDGSWQGNLGVTSLCALAFLNAGYDETDTAVNQAIQYILSRVRGDGSIYGDYYHSTYETSLAILALVATHNDVYTTIIDNARNWLVNSQWDESCLWGSVSKSNWYYGGFGYGYNVRPDLSNTQFAALALDAAGLPRDDPAWSKLQVFLHRCQRVDFSITLTIDGQEYTVQPYNSGSFDGGFAYTPGSISYGSMTGAGIWGLLLSGVPRTDQRVTKAIDWVINHYTWDNNIGANSRKYYYYLSMSKALTMYGEKTIGGHDWYQDLYNKITDTAEMIAVGTDKAKWVPLTYEDYVPDLPTAYALLSLQTRTSAPPVQRLSYLTFILRSNCVIRVLDPEGNLVGYNYMTRLGENHIPTAVYSGPFSESQYVVIVNPKLGTYKFELIGTSEGPYELTIQGKYGVDITGTFEYSETIMPAELHTADVMVSAIVGPIDIYIPRPPEPPAIDVMPKQWTKYDVLPREEICANFTISETTNNIDLQNVALVASDLTYGLFSIPSSCISFSDDDLTIPKGSHKNVTITLAVPPDTVYGNYAGSILITSKEGGDAIILMSIEIVRPTLYGDIDEDGFVGISDLSIAALAFGSFPGHPRWNPIADLNKDGWVDISDIAKIACNFGKTV